MQGEKSPVGEIGHVFINWATTFSSLPRQFYRPRSIEEVQEIFRLVPQSKDLVAEEETVRVCGSGHSPSDLACSNGTLIDISRLNKVLHVDPETRVVHVQAGITLDELNQALDKVGLAIPSLGSIADQTLAGAISTATHGTGATFGNLSTMVQWLDIVLPPSAESQQLSSTVVRVSKTEDPDLFYSALCGLGCLGVIVGAGIQVVNAFRLEEELWVMDMDEYIRNSEQILTSGQFVRCFWFPQLNNVVVSRLNKTTKLNTPKPNALKTWFVEKFLAKFVHALGLSVSLVYPNYIGYHARLMFYLVHRPGTFAWKAYFAALLGLDVSQNPVQNTIAWEDLSPITSKVDKSFQIFNYDCGFPQYTYEAAVPFENTSKSLRDLKEWYESEFADPRGMRCHFPIEIRPTEHDEIWLSPTYQQQSTYIGAVQYRPFNIPAPYRSIFSRFEAILLSNNARPHWAKTHTCTREALIRLYPRFMDFLKVRERVDPRGIMLNGYARRHLFGQGPKPSWFT